MTLSKAQLAYLERCGELVALWSNVRIHIMVPAFVVKHVLKGEFETAALFVERYAQKP